MRAFFLVSFVIIVLTLGVLEVVASKLTSERVGARDVRSAPTWLAR